MTKAENINLNKKVDIYGEWHTVTVKGIKFNNEYNVDIIIKDSWDVILVRKHIECKRISTINKVIAEYGVAI